MRVHIKLYQGRKTSDTMLALGEFTKLDRSRTVRLVGFDVESLNSYLIFGDGGGNTSVFCSTCKESRYADNLAEFVSFAIEHDMRHS